MELDDPFFLPQLQPEIAGNPTVVLVDAPVPLPPVIELAGGHAQPMDKPSDTDLSAFRPASDEIHDLVPHIMRNPVAGQSSPRLFFSAMCSAITPPKPRPWSAPSSPRTRSVSAFPPLGGGDAPETEKRRLRSRTVPSASGRAPLAAGPVLQTAPRLALCRQDAASGWLLFLPG